MKTIEQRVDNIIEWLKENHKEINYLTHNNVLSYFIKTNNILRTDWEKVRYEKSWEFLYSEILKHKIPHLTKKQYDDIKFNEEKKLFEIWIIENQYSPDRLSYSSIVDYLKKNNENELLRIFTKIYGKLKQKGLVKWFEEIGLTFYVQDNKKDLKKILNDLLSFAKKFYNDKGFTPNWTELELYGFKETKYLRTDGWNIDWQIDDLNKFYSENNLPKIPSKSDKSISEVMKIDVDSFLNEIIEFFGNIPSLRNLKSSDQFYDFCRYLRIISYHNDQSENEIYESMWKNKYGESYVELTRKLISIDGYWCDSMHELMFFNYLHLNGIKNNPHIPYNEIIVNWDIEYISDNILPNGIVCEVAGYHPNQHADYWNKINEKKYMCDKNNIGFLLIDGYKFINTKLEDFLDYLHKTLSIVLPNLEKPDFFMVIKSQHTVIYLREILSMFNNNQHFTMNIISGLLSKESFRFFMNYFGSIKKFKQKYSQGFHKQFPEISDFEINFDDKTFSKILGESKEDKITRGLKLLSDSITKEDCKILVSNPQKKYSKINGLFRNDGGESYWYSITRKEDGYRKLCDMIGFEIEIEGTTKDYYSNVNNLIEDLKYMKKVGNGFWVGIRHELFKSDFRIRRIHNYINRELNGVLNFRKQYKDIISEIDFQYLGNNTKLV